jgi:hypothetical protein
LKALGAIELGSHGEARQLALRAFENQPALALVAISSICEPDIDLDKLLDFFGEGDERTVAYSLVMKGLGHRLVFLAQTAVQAGFIKFSDEKAFLMIPDRMPSSYNYNISEL